MRKKSFRGDQNRKKRIKKIIGIFEKYWPSPLPNALVVKEMPHAESLVNTDLNYMEQETKQIAKEKNKRRWYYLTGLDVNTAADTIGFFGNSNIFTMRKDDDIPRHIFSFLHQIYSADFTQEKIMALRLFSLSNKIGALIVFNIIYGLDPENKYIAQTLEKVKVNRELATKEFIKNCMPPWDILLLNTMEYIRPPGYKRQEQPDGYNPVFLLDKDSHQSVTESYKRVYPEIYRKLNNIANRPKFVETPKEKTELSFGMK